MGTDIADALREAKARGVNPLKAARELRQNQAEAQHAAAEQKAESSKQNTLAEAMDTWPLTPLPMGTLTQRPPPPRWLLMRPPHGIEPDWKGFLRMGKVGLIAAPGGTGKTMALAGLALAVATGRPWLRPGAWRVPTPPEGIQVSTPGQVALLLGEEDLEDIRRRLYWTAQLMGLSPDDTQQAERRLLIAPLSGRDVSLVSPEGDFSPRLRQLELLLQNHAQTSAQGFSLILVDPLSRFAGLEAETKSGHATRFIAALERLTRLPGCPAVLFAHHERKAGGEGQDAIRGSSALVDGVRWAVRLVPVMDPANKSKRWTSRQGDRGIRLELVKTNYTPPGMDGYTLIQDGHHHGALRCHHPTQDGFLEAASAQPATSTPPPSGGRGDDL